MYLSHNITPLTLMVAYSSVGCLGKETHDLPDPSPCVIAEQNPNVHISHVVAGSDTACAVTTTGHMYCWGDTGTGIAGNPIVAYPSCRALRAPEHRCLREIGLDVGHGCGLTHDARAVCWGGNADGVLGDPAAQGGPFPNTVPGLADLAQVSAGG